MIEYLENAFLLVGEEEEKIDLDKHVYLITWSPDPSKLPDSDSSYQHLFNVNLLIDYLKYCSCGIFTHEFTQIGNPHYHGWYQVDQRLELGRVTMIKVLQKFGNLKIAPVRDNTKIKINNYSNSHSPLYYYKKESFDKIIPKNPITKDTTYDDTNWATKLFFFVDIVGKKKVGELLDHISNKKYYTNFYKKSD